MEGNTFVLGVDFRKALEIIDVDCPSDYGLKCTHDDCNETECKDCWADALCRYDEEHKELEFEKALDIVIAGATCHSMGSCEKCPYYNTPTCNNDVTCDKILKAVEIVKEGLNGRDW